MKTFLLLFISVSFAPFINVSPVLAAPVADALVGVPLVARWQTYKSQFGNGELKTNLVPTGLYKDIACTQPALSAGDSVAAVRDEISAGKLTFTQSDVAKCATLQFVAKRPVLRFDGIDDCYLLSTDLPLANLDLWARYKINTPPTTEYVTVVSGSTNGEPDYASAGGFYLPVQDLQRSTAQNIMQVVHLNGTNGSGAVFVEGVPIHAGKFSSGITSQLCLGARLAPSPASYLAMDLEALIIGQAVPPEKYALVDKYLGAHLDAPRLVCVGDSITDGTAGSEGLHATEEYPSQLQLLRPQRFVINSGQWGATISSVLPVSQQFSPDAQLIVFIGTNDLARDKTAEATFAELSAYCRARRDEGWKVYVATILPRRFGGDSRVSADFETKRQALNTAIRDQHAAFADGLIDFAADERIGDIGDEKNTEYFSPDQVHLSAKGARVLAEIAHAALPK